MATKAQLEGNKRHQEKLDRMVFYVDKGGKEKIKARAAETGAGSMLRPGYTALLPSSPNYDESCGRA